MTEQNNEQTEAKEDFIVMTNPITREQVSLPVSLQSYIQDIVRFNKKAGKENLENENVDLKNQIEALTKEFTEFKEASGKKKPEADEDVTKKFQEVIDQLNEKNLAAIGEKDQWLSKYQDERITNDLYAALSAYESTKGAQVHNKNQLVETLKIMNNAKLREDIDLSTGDKTGTFKTVLSINSTDNTGNIRSMELAAVEAVNKFLDMEENSFHLKNKLASGGGTRNGNTNFNGNTYEQQYNDAAKNKDLVGQIAAKQAEHEAMNSK